MLTNFELYDTATPDKHLPEARAHFLTKHGYPALECELRPFIDRTAIRLGPCYKTQRIERGEVLPGMTILQDTLWHCIAIVDGPTVLTDTDMLLTLPEVVTVRL